MDDASRLCNHCGTAQPLDAFSFRNKAKGTRGHTCRTCFTVYRREHYRLNKESYVRRNVANARVRRLEWSEKLWRFLLDHPCIDCGESDPVVLEFDHRDKSGKVREIQWLVHTTTRWDKVLLEIEKCDVRCANCHRRRTAEQFGWPKFAFKTLLGNPKNP
jgi:hypothetical protein